MTKKVAIVGHPGVGSSMVGSILLEGAVPFGEELMMTEYSKRENFVQEEDSVLDILDEVESDDIEPHRGFKMVDEKDTVGIVGSDITSLDHSKRYEQRYEVNVDAVFNYNKSYWKNKMSNVCNVGEMIEVTGTFLNETMGIISSPFIVSGEVLVSIMKKIIYISKSMCVASKGIYLEDNHVLSTDWLLHAIINNVKKEIREDHKYYRHGYSSVIDIRLLEKLTQYPERLDIRSVLYNDKCTVFNTRTRANFDHLVDRHLRLVFCDINDMKKGF